MTALFVWTLSDAAGLVLLGLMAAYLVLRLVTTRGKRQ